MGALREEAGIDQAIHVRPHVEGCFQLGGEIAGSYSSREGAAEAAQKFASRLLGRDRDVVIIVPMKDPNKATAPALRGAGAAKHLQDA